MATPNIVNDCIGLAYQSGFYPASIPELLKRVAELERKLAAIEGRMADPGKRSPPRGDS